MAFDRNAHAAEVASLWQAYGRGENDRVPIKFAADEQIWLKVVGETFGTFYRDPAVHLKAQLEGQRWLRENVICDMDPRPPDVWHVGVQLWMEENAYFGCQVVYQENDYAWGLPIDMDKDRLLCHLDAIDPEQTVRGGEAYAMYQSLCGLAAEFRFMDRPVRLVPPGNSTHGLFTKACEIRGHDRLCIDLFEEPEFVHKLMRILTEKTIARIKVWRELTDPQAGKLPSDMPWGMCDDSLQMLSADTYREFVLPYHERLYRAMTTGERSIHNCGQASQHYAAWVLDLGVSTIDGPGPFVDHGHYLGTLGPDFRFNAQTDDMVIVQGGERDIRQMMAGLLTPAAMRPGRYNIVGFVMPNTPLDNLRTCYRIGRELGAISA